MFKGVKKGGWSVVQVALDDEIGGRLIDTQGWSF